MDRKAYPCRVKRASQRRFHSFADAKLKMGAPMLRFSGGNL